MRDKDYNSKVYKKWEESAVLNSPDDIKVPAKDAFRMLHRRFIEKEDPEAIADDCKIYGVKRSFVLRIISPLEGVDTSRLPTVRAPFKGFMKQCGLPCPFQEYHCPPIKRKKPRPKGFNLLIPEGDPAPPYPENVNGY